MLITWYIFWSIPLLCTFEIYVIKSQLLPSKFQNQLNFNMICCALKTSQKPIKSNIYFTKINTEEIWWTVKVYNKMLMVFVCNFCMWNVFCHGNNKPSRHNVNGTRNTYTTVEYRWRYQLFAVSFLCYFYIYVYIRNQLSNLSRNMLTYTCLQLILCSVNPIVFVQNWDTNWFIVQTKVLFTFCK